MLGYKAFLAKQLLTGDLLLPKTESFGLSNCARRLKNGARESADIPSDVRGIYRYLRESGETVYIGRGEIRKRLSQPERQEWDFDRVEYSVVADPDQQVRWEDYWITRFKEANKGKLPIYNKISGSLREGGSEGENE
jgi:hypothetical protein